MTDKQTEALKLALEALMRSRPSVDYCKTLESCAYGSNYKEHKLADKTKALTVLDEAIIAIREALAQPQQEPVAMRHSFDGYGYLYIDSGSGSNWRERHKDAEPLYTSPPARKPLTDEQLEKVFPVIATYHESNKTLYRSIARAVEAAHDIKENI